MHYCRFWSSSGGPKKERDLSFLKRKDRSIDSKHFGRGAFELKKKEKKRETSPPPKIKKSIYNRTKVFSSSSFVFLLGQTKTTTTTLRNIISLLFRRRRGCCCGKNDDQNTNNTKTNEHTQNSCNQTFVRPIPIIIITKNSESIDT